jgi:hypothetical protein
MRSNRPRAGWAIALIGIWAAIASADHPLHSSRATVEFNTDTSSWEVSLCVFPDDLADALSKQAGRRVRIDQEPELDALMRDYVAQHFEMRLSADSPRPMEWLGHEFETQQAWLYFEFPFGDESPTAVQIKNTILMDQFDDQINVAYVRLEGRQRCMTFRTDTPSWNRWDVPRD